MAKTNFKKNGNGKKPSAPKMPGEWLYLNKEELPLRKIYEVSVRITIRCRSRQRR